MVWAYVDTVIGGLALVILYVHIHWHRFWKKDNDQHSDDD